MKSKFIKVLFAIILLTPVFGVTSQAMAQNDTNSSSTDSTVINLNLQNPIANSVNSIPEFFQKVIDIIIKIAIPFTAIVLVYCGLLFVTARGDTAQLEKARNAFTYAVIGGLVLLASWLIAQAIKDALTSLAYVF